ncbi:MAG: WecB/TagA/CpsF family glycosyltransferase [Geminicoccaceae bacterium]
MKTRFCEMPFSGVSVRDVIRFLETRTVNDPFGYIVTPNVDHIVRNWRSGGRIVEVYEDADLSLCDSRIVSLIARFGRISLPVVTGSDLTAILLDYVVDPDERLTVVGGSHDVVARLASRYGLRNIRHHNPPMGFIRDEMAILETAQFVERNASRFVLFAVGSPQQEMLAHRIKERGLASGIGLCVGASLLFLTGDLKRAPEWMQRARLEWLHRLLQEPKRMWRRYLYDGPRILRIASAQLSTQRAKPQPAVLVSIVVPTFRREELLPRLLERCAVQGGLGSAALEVVVVDNTPEASARAIVERVAARTATAIRYIHEPRPGIGHARNRGIAESRGEFIAFVDDDELPARVWLESLLRAYRVFGADVVLGPVRPVFEVTPHRFVTTYRAFFSQSSDAATGTPIEPHRPWRLRRQGACYRPLASNNALLHRATCFSGAEPFDPDLGLTGGEDTLFFTQLQRAGKKIVWCREALVHERVPTSRLTPGFLLRRKFRDGQITSSTCLRLTPPAYGELAGWMTVGLAQLVLGGAKTAVFGPISRRRGLEGLCVAATGLGKLAFLDRFRGHHYGARAFAANAVPKAG